MERESPNDRAASTNERHEQSVRYSVSSTGNNLLGEGSDGRGVRLRLVRGQRGAP